MKRLRTIAVVGALLAIVASPFAWAAGLWFGLPVVGGASYCAGATATGVGLPGGGTTSCNTTAPAGPADLTGNELIPADANTGGTPGVPGAGTTGSPQSVYIPVPSAASGAWLLTSANGLSTISISTPIGVTNLVVNATGTLTALNIAPPPGALDGQVWRFGVNNIVTTVTLQTPSNGATFDTQGKVTALATAAAGIATNAAGYAYVFQSSTNKWWRLY